MSLTWRDMVCTRSREEDADRPTEFVMIERFENEATFIAHVTLEYSKDLGRRMGGH